MTEQEIAELVQRLRLYTSKVYSWNLVHQALNDAADATEALQASLALCERRADEAEARNVFLLTELERILKEAK